MTHAQAHNLLDDRKEGASMAESVVTRALELTGDLDREPTAYDFQREIELEVSQ